MEERVMDVTRATIEQLQARLDRLAIAVQDGEPGAREEYAATIDELARLRGDQDREEDLRVRAERQRAVQAEAEREAQLEARRRALEKEYAEAEAKLKELAPEIDRAAVALLELAQNFLLPCHSEYLKCSSDCSATSPLTLS